MPEGEYNVEIIDLDTDELGEFDALAVCRNNPPTSSAEDDDDVPEDDQERLPEVADEP